jgi:hypothetical protein
MGAMESGSKPRAEMFGHKMLMSTTQALHALKSKGGRIGLADLAFLSPYATSKLKRFGDYPTNVKPEAMPTTTTLPV